MLKNHLMRHCSLLMLFVAIGFSVLAQNSKLTPQTRLSLWKNQMQKRSVSVVNAVVTLEKDADVAPIEKLGAKVHCRVGDILTATIPVKALEELCQLQSVKMVSVGDELQPCNDKMRLHSNVNPVQAGIGLPTGYSGKDVVVGVIDQGFDFNHLMFKDSLGASRIKAAMIYDEMDSVNPYHYYTTPNAIDSLTTDNHDSFHGTHTTGIAAGHSSVNEFYGVAPDADLVLCGLSSLSANAFITALDFVFRYADSVGKPAVVNASMGTPIGSHDSLRDEVRAIRHFTHNKPGHVVCVSSGNEGDKRLAKRIDFEADGDSVFQGQMLIEPIQTHDFDSVRQEMVTHNRVVLNIFDLWSADSTSFGVQMSFFDTSTRQTVWMSDIVYCTPERQLEAQFASEEASIVAIGTGSQVPSNNRYQTMLLLLAAKSDSNLLLGIHLYGRQGTVVYCYSSSHSYGSYNIDGFENADDIYNVNSLACSNDLISVGAYNSRIGYTGLDGRERSTYGADGFSFTEGDIADFSSAGKDFYGISRPDVAAPGSEVVSSTSTYFVEGSIANEDTLAAKCNVQPERIDYWMASGGTSMSCPVVTGITALWLEANPSLTTSDIRQIIRQTSRQDEFFYRNPQKFGAGKIDALAGVQMVLSRMGIEAPTSTEDPKSQLDFARPFYDLLGRRVGRGYRGVVVQDGHKYLIKATSKN